MPNRLRIYQLLLRLYPKAYRERYGREMLQTLTDMLDDQPTERSKIALWLRVAADLPASAIKQYILTMETIQMSQTMPTSIKWPSIVAGLCLLPFMISVFANAISTRLFGHALYRTWLWSSPILRTWVIILPALALLIALIGYSIYAFWDSSVLQKRSFLQLLDIRRVWPVFICALFAAGILFIVRYHDSGQCVTKNPTYAFGHISQTWQCIQTR